LPASFVPKLDFFKEVNKFNDLREMKRYEELPDGESVYF